MATQKSKHPVLPQLKEQRQTAGFNERGQWSARQAIALDQLSDDLDVAGVGVDINSIPDMWARPLLFEMALLQPEHLLGPRVIGEWRGLLAMLALKDVLGIGGLTAVPIKLSPPEENPAKLTTPGDPDFLKTLSRLAPTRTFSPKTTWRDLYVILNGTDAIGMTSPTTLVATATSYFGRLDGNQVPWFDGKWLLDPTGKTIEDSQNFLSESAREALSWWMNELRNGLTQLATAGDFNSRSLGGNALVTRIGEYIRDLGPARQAHARGSGYGISSGIFALLDKPVKHEGGDPEDSDVLLHSSRREEWLQRRLHDRSQSEEQRSALQIEAFRKVPPILMADDEIARDWNKDKRDVKVWGSASLQNSLPYGGLEERPPEGKKQYLGINGVLAQLWSPKWLFKEHLYVVRKADAFPRSVGNNLASPNQPLSYGNEVVTPILPFDRILIDQLTIDDLGRRISFEQRHEGIFVRLELELSGPDRRGRIFECSRLYRADQGQIKVIEDVPLLVIWPDFKAPQWGWKAYYTYYDTAEVKETFAAKPYVPKSTASLNPDHPDDAEPAMEVRSLSAGGQSTRLITRMDSYPEAMLCSMNEGKDDIGFLLVQQPIEAEKVGISYKVGVDFGATGTNVYFRAGDKSPEAFQFSERYVFVTSVSAERQATMFDIALPARTEPTPFLSFFKMFPSAPADGLRPLMDGIIHFPHGAKLEEDPRIIYNLKWSGREEDTLKVEAFLKQICLQVATEAVSAGASQVEWWFSFPTAFSEKRKKAFSIIWQNVTNWCTELTGLGTSGAPQSRTESVATALYFRDPNGHNASTPTGAVCIDIGGSTSDIAIWQKKLCWQTSLRFAGRDIFLNFLLANPEFLGKIKKGVDTNSLLKTKTRGLFAFYAQADTLLREQGEQLFANLPHFAEEPEMVKLEQVLSLSIAGVFYYVGLLIRYLREKGIYSLEVPRFYIGGNGSRIFRWLSLGEPFNSEAKVNEVFKTAFLRASGLSQNPLSIEISGRPKAEAAFGLICGTHLEEQLGADYGVLAGESYVLKGKHKPWDNLVSAKDFQNDLSAAKTLDQINDFLVAFDQAALHAEIRQVAPANADREDLIKKVRIGLANAIDDTKQLGKDGIEVEPIFILALKSLLKIITEENR